VRSVQFQSILEELLEMHPVGIRWHIQAPAVVMSILSRLIECDFNIVIPSSAVIAVPATLASAGGVQTVRTLVDAEHELAS